MQGSGLASAFRPLRRKALEAPLGPAKVRQRSLARGLLLKLSPEAFFKLSAQKVLEADSCESLHAGGEAPSARPEALQGARSFCKSDGSGALALRIPKESEALSCGMLRVLVSSESPRAPPPRRLR